MSYYLLWYKGRHGVTRLCCLCDLCHLCAMVVGVVGVSLVSEFIRCLSRVCTEDRRRATYDWCNVASDVKLKSRWYRTYSISWVRHNHSATFESALGWPKLTYPICILVILKARTDHLHSLSSLNSLFKRSALRLSTRTSPKLKVRTICWLEIIYYIKRRLGRGTKARPLIDTETRVQSVEAYWQ